MIELHEGQVIDRYVVEGPIAAGGMASVWRVRHTVLGSTFALKVLHGASPATRERLVQEGRLQSTLRHPNIVQVTDVVTVGEHPALVMEHVDGVDLQTLLDRGEPLDAESVFRAICAAVGAAHALGVVHRDLKPANVLMARTADGWLPKVADFGLAKAARGNVAHTRVGTAMGTPSYMAPEQIRDASTVDQRADVFSLGCILYELALRKKAFPGDDPVAVWHAITNGPRPATAPLPRRLARVVDHACRVEPTHRPASVKALLALLDAPPAAPASAWWPAAIAVAVVSVGLFGAVGILAVTSSWWAATADPVVDSAAPEPPPAPPDDGLPWCEAGDAERLGVVRVGPYKPLARPLKVGAVWTARDDVEVTQSPGGAPFCRLPAGTEVDVTETPIRILNRGVYVAVIGGGFRAP
jgi:hypothetical protein